MSLHQGSTEATSQERGPHRYALLLPLRRDGFSHGKNSDEALWLYWKVTDRDASVMSALCGKLRYDASPESSSALEETGGSSFQVLSLREEALKKKMLDLFREQQSSLGSPGSRWEDVLLTHRKTRVRIAMMGLPAPIVTISPREVTACIGSGGVSLELYVGNELLKAGPIDPVALKRIEGTARMMHEIA